MTSNVIDSWINVTAKLDSLKCQADISADADACRNVSEIIRSRGFEVEEYDITSADGYIIAIQRLINPLVDKDYRARRRPVLLEPGYVATSVDWVIDSVYVRPTPWSSANETGDEGHREGGLS